MSTSEPPESESISWLGWAALAVLAGFQLWGWLGYGKAKPVDAMILLTYSATLVIGGIFPWWYRRMKPTVFLLPLALIGINVSMFSNTKRHRTDSLMHHAYEELMGKPGGTFELFLIEGIYFGWIAFLAAMTAYVSAEISQRCGVGDGGGALFSRLKREVVRFEKTIDKKEDHE